MMQLHKIILVAALAGCYDPALGGAPFRCTDGRCPTGYRCAQQYCVGPGDPEPPTLIGLSTDETAEPIPVWDGRLFGVFWQQNTPGLPVAAGLHFSSEGIDRVVVGETGDVAFDAIWHPAAKRYVVAFRKHGETEETLRVVSFAGADDKPAHHFPPPGKPAEPPAAFGYSAPSLVARKDRSVTLGYAFGAPPRVAKDNAYCWHLDLADPARAESCAPSVRHTNGAFVTEVLVAELGENTLIFWRDQTVHVTLRARGMELAPPKPGEQPNLLHVARAAIALPNVALAAQLPGTAERPPTWTVTAGTFAVGETRRSLVIPTFHVVPDVVAEGSRFVACRREQDGELSLLYLRGDTLQLIGAPQRVHRLSRAEIASCRLAAAPGTGRVAVAWQERVPAAGLRSYVTVIREER
jgi:hypothetical protein